MCIKRVCLFSGLLGLVLHSTSLLAASDVPKYKPSSRAPQALDIRTNAYGFSRSAPEALSIGDTAPDIVAVNADGNPVSLRDLRSQGPVVIVFYRGHW